MSTLGRPITQIAVAQSESESDETVRQTIVALCSDRTVWYLELDSDAGWHRLPPIPLGEEC